MAAALCRHQDARDHAAARVSLDPTIAAESRREEVAAAQSSKKGSQSPESASHWLAGMLPDSGGAAPLLGLEPLRLRPSTHSALNSRTVIPLLEPPSA